MTEKIEAFGKKERYTLADAVELVEILRGPDGCTWDREQTHSSVRNALIEEAYELVEGIDLNDAALMREEMGDVLFQVLFHAEIERENGAYTVDDVADELCKKMVLRHPHVFGDVKVKDSGEVIENWDAIKKVEKARDTVGKQLESVPKTLPSLIRAEKLLSRYKKNGGNVEKDAGVLVGRIREKAEALTENVTEEEIGEFLFLVANLTYAKKINAEEALYRRNERFTAEKSKEEDNA